MNPGPVVREGFSRDDRLRKRREFEECYASGVRMSGRHLQLFILSKPGGEKPRLGISVPKRVGNAVVRNRLKRCVREAFRRNPGSAPRRSLWIVVHVRSSAAQASGTELATDYRGALSRAVLRGIAKTAR